MEDVLEKGTGVAARLDNMHAAGRTGTTNEAKDLVFAGFYTILYRCHLGNV